MPEQNDNKNILGEFFKKPLVRYTGRRVFNSLITLFFIVTAVFLLMRMMPKSKYIDYMFLNKQPWTEEQKQEYIDKKLEDYGLNDPILIQLGNYYMDLIPYPKTKCLRERIVDLDTMEMECSKEETFWVYFGESITYKPGKPVTELVSERFPTSLKLNLIALVFMYIVGYPLGVFMAKNKGKAVDKIGNGYIIATLAVPALVYYYLWQIVGMKFLQFPSRIVEGDWTSWVMPVWAITFIGASGSAVYVRRFMVDEMNSDYVKFARSKGLPERRIMFRHVLRNAIVPLIRTVPAQLILALIGSYFVEMLWTIPGTGNLLINALRKGDNPLVQALVIVYSGLSMVAVLLGDLITVFFDPRISLTKNK